MREQRAWSDGAYAGFWQRVKGFILDSLLAIAAAMLLIGGAALSPDRAAKEALAEIAIPVVSLAVFAAYFLYDTLMTSRTGATLGKTIAFVEVRTSSGELPSFARCTGRFFARYLSAIPLLLGFLWAGWDPQRQTWHDKLCGTVVLKREALVRAESRS